jgi:hypothetical protein
LGDNPLNTTGRYILVTGATIAYADFGTVGTVVYIYVVTVVDFGSPVVQKLGYTEGPDPTIPTVVTAVVVMVWGLDVIPRIKLKRIVFEIVFSHKRLQLMKALDSNVS